MITREYIIDTLEKIALLLEVKGENPFKIRAYRNGAEILEKFSGDIFHYATEKKLSTIKGIGKALAEKIEELITTGKLLYFEKLKAEFPDSLFELFEIQGLGGKKISILHRELGISSIAELKDACERGDVAQLKGFGEKTAQKILAAMAFRQENANRFQLGDVEESVHTILHTLRNHTDVIHAEVAGSYRRGKEIVHDVDFLVASKKQEAVITHFVSQPFVEEVISQGKTKSSIRLHSGLQCDLRVVSETEYPYALSYFTGSKEHNVKIRRLALKKGYSLNEYGLTSTKAKEAPSLQTEADLYNLLDLTYIDPELREDQGEIEAAENDALPQLVTFPDLQGTFHNHTTASDGKNSLPEMARAARAMGLCYLGIADHSKSSFQANGLSEAQLLEQVKKIRELNKEFEGFRLFAGVECDILKDGTLDFSDDILAQLDYVVASVHSSFTLSEKEMTQRVVRAMNNPHVTMLGHPTGRLLLKRQPYQIHLPTIIDTAAETNTLIELNANPYRLDMDWRWWKHAKEKGVRCVINPDAHSIEGLQRLSLGVKIARKGWLEKEDVFNCFPLQEVEFFLHKS